MFVFGELFRALALLVNGAFTIMSWVLIARIVISWFPVDPYHQVVQILHQMTEPILAPLRRLPLNFGMMDFSPLVAFILLSFTQRILVGILIALSHQFGLAPGY